MRSAAKDKVRFHIPDSESEHSVGSLEGLRQAPMAYSCQQRLRV